MTTRYETPLLVDVKIEELKILGKKNIKSVSFVQCKPKTHDNKFHAPPTTWPQEQFCNPTPILTHDAFVNTHDKDFRVKKNLPNFKS